VYVVLYDYALDLSKKVPRDFQVTQAELDEFYSRLKAKGVDVERSQWDAGRRYIARTLEQRVTRFAFGDAAAKQRDLAYDAPLRRAIDVLEHGQTQKDLFAIASTLRTADQPSTPAPHKP
jgi:hypothetical protein